MPRKAFTVKASKLIAMEHEKAGHGEMENSWQSYDKK
jgi:hypothetical protein